MAPRTGNIPVKRQLLFVQGGGKGTHDEWDSKLVESLRRALGEDYEIVYPRMPNEDEPSYPRWKKALQKAFEKLREGAVLVGHSVGGTILVKLLSERVSPPNPSAICLVAAPFVGAGGWSFDDLSFPADLGARLPRNVPLHFFHGLEDDIAPPSHVELFGRAVPQARIYRLRGRDHQLNDDLSEVAAAISEASGLGSKA
jgi:predicted alpha/beta hydrolase family esterase